MGVKKSVWIETGTNYQKEMVVLGFVNRRSSVQSGSPAPASFSQWLRETS